MSKRITNRQRRLIVVDGDKTFVDLGVEILLIDDALPEGGGRYRRIPKESIEVVAPPQAANGKEPQTLQPGELPSLPRMALNKAKADVKHVATGRKHVPLEVLQQRFESCKKCPAKKFRFLSEQQKPEDLKGVAEVGRCLHQSCGCFLHATEQEPNKLWRAEQHCPLPKEERAWDVYQENEAASPQPDA